MIRTRVGYAGGQKDSPTYRSMGDHTEAVQLDYDPRIISYEELLDIFWDNHDPSSTSFSRQYMKAIFYHNTEQRDTALASKSELESTSGIQVKTPVVPVLSFTMAEDYHQKFSLKNHQFLKKEMVNRFPNHLDLVNSHAASRINGYVGGYGTKKQLLKEINNLGLSPEGQKVLTNMVPR